jgi:anti-sigma regulatory factor (Ser/Thr protein kinase)
MADEHLEPVKLPINNLINVVTTRRRGLEMALKLGFSLPDATKIAVVISELARNRPTQRHQNHCSGQRAGH